MILAAITGSIGCGKTTLANIFKKQGYPVFDADAWVRRLYFKPDFIKLVLQNFPEAQTDGVFDKRKLRLIVFDDKKKLEKLENLIHPFLKKQLKTLIRKNAKSDDILFLDAALLFELGWEKYCDFVIAVNVDEEVQKQRVMNRDNVSLEHVEKIIQKQMSQQEKVKKADWVVETDVPLNLLKVAALEIIKGLNGWEVINHG